MIFNKFNNNYTSLITYYIFWYSVVADSPASIFENFFSYRILNNFDITKHRLITSTFPTTFMKKRIGFFTPTSPYSSYQSSQMAIEVACVVRFCIEEASTQCTF